MYTTLKDLTPAEAAKYVAEHKYAWPGGYPLGVLCTDGGVLCADCVEKNLELIADPDANADWRPACAFVADADDALDDEEHAPTTCDNCYRVIYSD